jgi:hypothetical protein
MDRHFERITRLSAKTQRRKAKTGCISVQRAKNDTPKSSHTRSKGMPHVFSLARSLGVLGALAVECIGNLIIRAIRVIRGCKMSILFTTDDADGTDFQATFLRAVRRKIDNDKYPINNNESRNKHPLAVSCLNE